VLYQGTPVLVNIPFPSSRAVPEALNSEYILHMDFYEQLFDEQYEIILASLEARALKAGFSLEQIENELESLYRYDGLDQDGRGTALQARNEGAILAYQVFLRRRKQRGEEADPRNNSGPPEER